MRKSPEEWVKGSIVKEKSQGDRSFSKLNLKIENPTSGHYVTREGPEVRFDNHFPLFVGLTL